MSKKNKLARRRISVGYPIDISKGKTLPGTRLLKSPLFINQGFRELAFSQNTLPDMLEKRSLFGKNRGEFLGRVGRGKYTGRTNCFSTARSTPKKDEEGIVATGKLQKENCFIGPA